jgi:hypothetical protein
VTVLKRKKSYHSIVVPIVLATTLLTNIPRSLRISDELIVYGLPQWQGKLQVQRLATSYRENSTGLREAEIPLSQPDLGRAAYAYGGYMRLQFSPKLNADVYLCKLLGGKFDA